MTARSSSFKFIRVSDVAKKFNADFIDHARASDFLLTELHGEVMQCPYCLTEITGAVAFKSFWTLKRLQCKTCKRWFTATSWTILQNSQFTPSEFILLCFLLDLQVPDTRIAKVLNTHPDTIKIWRKKLNALE